MTSALHGRALGGRAGAHLRAAAWIAVATGIAACATDGAATGTDAASLDGAGGTSGGGVCSLPLESGPCEAAFERFGFDTSRRECVSFTYGGCEGNGNNFATLAECEVACEHTTGNPGCEVIKCGAGEQCVYDGDEAVCATPCAEAGACESGTSCGCGTSCPQCKDCVSVCL